MPQKLFSQVPQDEEEINLDELNQQFEPPNDHLPLSVYFIIPNELAERFCFYGISPLLKNFFMTSLNFSQPVAYELYHIFNMMAYFTPLLGAALSDSFLDKFHTITSLSLVYVLGGIVLSVTSTPHLLGVPPFIPAWGPLLGLTLIALGTGGIKPCVSAHGGDQFTPQQAIGLNKFYNYFYTAINVGSLIAGFTIPYIAKMNIYGSPGDGYPVAFGVCTGVLGMATLLFILGKGTYRVSPPAGIFLPYHLIKTGSTYVYHLFRNPRNAEIAKIETQQQHGKQLLEEFLDLMNVIVVMIPASFFWMAFNQNGSSWQGLTDQMNSSHFLDSVVLNAVLNPIFIVVLAPLFGNYIYPCIDKSFPGKFGLLNRMIAGMLFTGFSFLICAFYQRRIDQSCVDTYFDTNGKKILICYDASFSSAWFILPYFVITIGEVLFSISGLNFAYSEVGPRLKSTCAALWLLTVAFGNLLATVLMAATEDWDMETFFYLNAGLCFGAAGLQYILNKFYVYKANRPSSLLKE